MAVNANGKKYKNNIRQKINNAFEFVELIAISLGVILFVSLFFARHSLVVGGSMEKTLSNGDYLIISNFAYEPKVGDIVVCQISDEQQQMYPATLSKKEAIVKRVIAVGGQTVMIENGTVYVDGVPLNEEYKYLSAKDSVSFMSEVIVPEGHVFVMGDHRNNSLDSRYVGGIDERLILGKVIFRIAPLSKIGSLYD